MLIRLNTIKLPWFIPPKHKQIFVDSNKLLVLNTITFGYIFFGIYYLCFLSVYWKTISENRATISIYIIVFRDWTSHISYCRHIHIWTFICEFDFGYCWQWMICDNFYWLRYSHQSIIISTQHFMIHTTSHIWTSWIWPLEGNTYLFIILTGYIFNCRLVDFLDFLNIYTFCISVGFQRYFQVR